MSEQLDLLTDLAAPDEYLAFLQKFEAKKTTDDCYTPAAVYQAVLDWAVSEYNLQGRRVVRPFYPGSDYQAFDYQPGDVVIDNPPFSIMTKIVRFYEAKGVDFLLFAPSLTLFGVRAKTSIVTYADVIYENSAKVSTSFVTSLDNAACVRTAPALKRAIRDANVSKAKTLPKYAYPDELISAALLNKITAVPFAVPHGCASFTRVLDSQREAKKQVFGGGFLIDSQSAAELRAAELRAAEPRAAEHWPLSERELAIITALDEVRTNGLLAPETKQVFLHEPEVF